MTEIPSLKAFMKSKGRAGNSKRGEEFQDEIVSALQSLGFQTQVAVPAVKPYWNRKTGQRGWVTKSADFFGCVDIVAFHAEAPWTLFIQATTDRGLATRKMLDVAGTFTTYTPARRVEVWTRNTPAPKDWTIWRQQPAGAWDHVDYRRYVMGVRLALTGG